MTNNHFDDEKLLEEFNGLKKSITLLTNQIIENFLKIKDAMDDISDRAEFIYDGLGLDEMEKEPTDEELLIPEQELYTFEEAKGYAKEFGKEFECLAWEKWQSAKGMKRHCALVFDRKEAKFGISSTANYSKFRTYFTADEEAGLWVEKQWPQ